MSSYYEFDVNIEGRGRVGIYADDLDEARDLAFECDITDIDVKDVNVTDADLLKATKLAS